MHAPPTTRQHQSAPTIITTARRFGRILLRVDAMSEKPVCDLASDPVLNPLPFEEFSKALEV